MRELKLLLFLSAVLSLSGLADGCGGKITSSNTAATMPGSGGANPTPMPSASPTPTPSDPAPTPTPTATPSPAPTPNSTTISNIQKLSGWQVCTGACTNTAPAVPAMEQGIASPSLSGEAARFQLLAGSQPFGGALWFKYVGNFDSPTHFVYDLFFYVDNPTVAQAIEFTVSQSSNGSRYNFSTQCLLVGQQLWRVWDPVNHGWANSSVPCVAPAANTWNRLTWEFERDSSGNAIFTAVTVNGNRQVVNLSMPNVPDGQTGLSVSFQSDANLNAVPYSVWLDNVSLTYW